MSLPNTGRRALSGALATAPFASLLGTSAFAQSGWPNKPLKMIVGYTPGGFTDTMARTIGEPLGRALGQTMLFDYKPGANSQIGVDMVAKAPADGYTLAGVIAAHAANPALYPKMAFDAINDFVPIAVTGIVPLILVVNNNLPVQNIAEFVAYVKARPGKLNFGSSGTGAAAHLGMEAFMLQQGLKMQHVPYKGTQPALTDCIGGQIECMFDTPSSMMTHVRAGKIRTLGIGADKRLSAFPEVPTFTEGGVPFIGNSWSMILAPAKTPREICVRLNAEVQKILASQAVREKLDSLGIFPGGGGLEEAMSFLKAEVDKAARIVRDANVKLDG